MSQRRRSGYTENPDAVRELMSQPSAFEHLDNVATVAAGRIRALTPKRSGRLARSWRSKVIARDGRPVAIIYTWSPRWHLIEYGTADMYPRRPVGNAMRGIGLRYRPTPKA